MDNELLTLRSTWVYPKGLATFLASCVVFGWPLFALFLMAIVLSVLRLTTSVALQTFLIIYSDARYNLSRHSIIHIAILNYIDQGHIAGDI